MLRQDQIVNPKSLFKNLNSFSLRISFVCAQILRADKTEKLRLFYPFMPPKKQNLQFHRYHLLISFEEPATQLILLIWCTVVITIC